MENAAVKMSSIKVNKKVSRKRKIPIGNGILKKEEEKIPLGEIFRRMKRKRRKMMRSVSMIDETIPLAEFYKKIKRIQSTRTKRKRRPISSKKNSSMRTPILRKEDEKIYSSPPPESFIGHDGFSEEDSEEEKKYIRRSPVVITDLKEYLTNFRLRAFGDKAIGCEIPEEPEEESEEELLLECDRNEVDWGYNYVLRQRWRAITNPVVPKKIYYKSDADCYPIQHVLHDPERPLPLYPNWLFSTIMLSRVHTMNMLVWSRHTCELLLVTIMIFVLKPACSLKKPSTFKLPYSGEFYTAKQILSLLLLSMSTDSLQVYFLVSGTARPIMCEKNMQSRPHTPPYILGSFSAEVVAVRDVSTLPMTSWFLKLCTQFLRYCKLAPSTRHSEDTRG